MKKLLILASVIVSSLGVMAQQKTDDLIKINSAKYDFGKIKQGTPVTTFFTITNSGSTPIAIESATAGCGCTTPEFSREPFAPGTTTKLKVGYNAAAPGHFEKDVTIKIAGAQDTKVIKITGEVVDAAAFEALSKAPGQVKPTQAAVKEVKETKKAAKDARKASKKATTK